MTSLTQDNRQARIDTPLGNDVLLLQSFRGTESLSHDFEYIATVLSAEDAIDGNQIVGKRISTTYFSEDGRERHFNGFVSRFSYLEQVEEPAKLTSYQVTMVPWLWFLKHNRDCQIFQEMTVPDIIKQIFQTLGYTDFRLQLTESYPEREYCVQYRETDFDFVSRLMEEEGIFYFFEHSKDKHILVLCDAPTAYFDLEEADVGYSPLGQSHLQQLTGWQHHYEFRPAKVAQKDFNFKKPTDALKTDLVSRVKFDGNSHLEVYDYPGLYDESGKGQRLTKVRLEELESEHDYVDSGGHFLTFTPGGKFKIELHSCSGEEGKSYALVEVFTEFRSNLGFDHQSDDDFRNEFRCIPAQTTFRPVRKTRKPIVEGPQTAIVVTDGQEIVVDEHARVKVQFHWDRYGQKDINSSCWIRVSQVHAGQGWGMIDIPRQHEEVIVSFLDGDPDRPIITGRVYNGDNQPPFDLKGAGDNSKNKTRRGNYTKTYEADGYNEITMDDDEGKEQIRIHAQHNMDTVVLNDSKSRIYGNRHQIIGWEKDGDKGGDQKELVWQDKRQNIKRDQIEHIEGNAQLMIGNGDADGGKLEVVIENQELRQIGEGGLHQDIAGSHIEKVGGMYSLDVAGDYMAKFNGNAGFESGAMGEVHMKAGSKFVIDVGSTGTLSINGPGGFIKIDNKGITIQGMMVNINSGGSPSSGGGCSPESPTLPEQAEPGEPGRADKFKS